MLAACYILFLHFVADFLLQSREMGKKKSSELYWLFQHLGIQFFVIGIGSLFVLGAHSIWFAIFNTLIHGIIDWNIWRLYKWSAGYRIRNKLRSAYAAAAFDAEVAKWQYWEDHWFYATIGLDQFLHASTILLLLWWLV